MTLAWLNELLKPGITANLEDGVWRYHSQQDDQFYGEYLPREFLEHLDFAKVVGWREAVEHGLRLLPPEVADYTRDYFLAPYRSDFVEELKLGPGAKVLDLACGWGFASQRCLEKGTNVVGTEIARKRLQFCVDRFAQQGFGERFVGVELDANRSLPFVAGSFDAVIVSGLLEWVACSKTGDPGSIQREFMDQVFSVVRPGGLLFLAIENRYWSAYFRGAQDLHTHRPWASILPRRLGRAYSILRYGEDYRAFCYSLTDYLNWFQRQGYHGATVLYPEPDYVQPKQVSCLMRDLQLDRPSPLKRREILQAAGDRRAAAWGRSFMFIVTK